MKAAWSKDLVETRDFDFPINELLLWRSQYGLEALIAFRRQLAYAEVPRSEYAMCSPNTQNLAEIYTNYMYQFCCDERPMNYYPLLDRIVEWMETEYGEKANRV